MKLKFSEYVEDQRLHGLTRLNFNAGFNDASLMRTRLAFSICAAMGVPTPRTAYAWFAWALEPRAPGGVTAVEPSRS